ncbi:MAG: TetR/AcrR family transcriptional regulator [Tetrasphaera sp.]|nr:TetR/AcrR family transcriptional regulator [Tetrasphaera sp.]
MPSALTPPARGTRPRNRRAITIAAAVDLFARQGYPNVSMGDVAASTNVGASAIYRHFRGKADLLIAAIQTELQPYTAAVETAKQRCAAAPDASPQACLDDALRALSAAAVEHRKLGVLWQREARSLAPEELGEVRAEMRATTGMLRELVEAARPDLPSAHAGLLAWCAMGAIVSLGFHNLTLPRDALVELLTDIASTIVSAELAASPENGAGTPPRTASRSGGREGRAHDLTRRQEILATAVHLFADRGFGTVTVDEIGEAVGIAGPSLYGHFENKQQILAEAMAEGSHRLHRVVERVRTESQDPAAALAFLIDSYIDEALGDRFLLRVVLSDMDALEPEERAKVRSMQRDYIDAWSAFYGAVTGEETVRARIRVQAVLLLINDAVQTPHLQAVPDLRDALRAIAAAVLR